MARIAIASFALAMLGLGALLYGQQDQDKKYDLDTSRFMARKLDGARQIVSGLATEDFAQIGKAAQDLLLLSNESDWNVVQTEAYLRMSSDFRNSAIRLRDAANDKSIDGATLAYFEVTLNCVRCHKYLRHEPKD